jgi:hypothetical protein
MRKRETEARQKALSEKVAEIVTAYNLPAYRQLLNMSSKEWDTLPCDPLAKAWLSAGMKSLAHAHGLRFAMIPTAARAKSEQRAIAIFRYPSYEAEVQLKKLTGAIYALVPYAEAAGDREAVLRGLWPTTEFQYAYWNSIIDLAAMLSHSGTPRVSHPDVHVDLVDTWGESVDEVELENEQLAILIQKSSADRLGIDTLDFEEPRLRQFYAAFGVKGIRRIAESNRLSVALAVCTQFWQFEAGDSRWEAFRRFLGAVEQLVDACKDHGLDLRCLAGGPLSASAADLSGFTIPERALQNFQVVLELRYKRICQERLMRDLGERFPRPTSEAETALVGAGWDSVYAGVPALREFVNDHLFPSRYGCIVEGFLWPLPKRWRLGPAVVEDDLQQLEVGELSRIFCFGCDLLGEIGRDPRLLRSWISLWLGGLRPQESYPLMSSLIPCDHGLIVVVPRAFGKTGSREAVFPESGLMALGVGAEHFGVDNDGVSRPDELARQACGEVREAWQTKPLGSNEIARPAIPDRLAYFVRKAIADVIRWNAPDPTIARVLGHEVAASDLAYTQVGATEAIAMQAFVRTALGELIGVPEHGDRRE